MHIDNYRGRVHPIKMYRWNEHDRIVVRYTCNSRGRRIAVVRDQ